MGRKEKKLSYHKLVETKSKSDFSREEFSTSPVNRIPLKRVRHHPSYIRWGLSPSVRFCLLEVVSGSWKLSKEQINGDILNLSEKGMLISTKYHIPDEGFLLATLILDQTIILEGILGKIKKVEFQDNGDLLVGVEFSSIEKLKEVSSPEEIENLPVRPVNFKQRLHDIIFRRLHKDEIVPQSKRNGH
jgi:hypothetical protein